MTPLIGVARHRRLDGVRREPPSTHAAQAVREATSATAAFAEYFRLPDGLVSIDTASELSGSPGYFTLDGHVCFARCTYASPARSAEAPLTDVAAGVSVNPDSLVLPFDLGEVVRNLREERYEMAQGGVLSRMTSGPLAQALYYRLRPAMPVGVRRHLQRVRLHDWRHLAFPRWPVDATVDELMRHTMGLVLRATGKERLPFIWFWPDGAPTCTMLTHDVEGEVGLAGCGALMDLDGRYGLKSSFQLIPEGPGNPHRALEDLRARGFEVNVHDLNHDGQLFRERAEFLRRAQRINAWAREWQCDGFRSGAMYRDQRWFDSFDVSFDMSVPSVAHLEPQRGGCCTVMPYFVGRLLELPLTTVQDYSLFFVLGDYSMRLWNEQIDAITQRNGLLSFITHPDYLVGERERQVYTMLLERLARLRDDGRTWVALPTELNRWWRDRQAMTLTRVGSSWRIDGPGRERARLGYAVLEGDSVRYSVEDAA